MDSIHPTFSVDGAPQSEDGEHTVCSHLSIARLAATLPGKGPLSMMIMLLTLSDRLSRTDHLLLLPRTLREFSLSRTTAYRSLELLEQAGLVTVKRQKGGHSPMVTLTLRPKATADAASEDC